MCEIHYEILKFNNKEMNGQVKMVRISVQKDQRKCTGGKLVHGGLLTSPHQEKPADFSTAGCCYILETWPRLKINHWQQETPLAPSDKDAHLLLVGMQTGTASVQYHEAALAPWSSNHGLWCLPKSVEIYIPTKVLSTCAATLFIIVKSGIKTFSSWWMNRRLRYVHTMGSYSKSCRVTKRHCRDWNTYWVSPQTVRFQVGNFLCEAQPQREKRVSGD